MEVQCGGLCTFFANCGPAYAVRAADAFRTLGMESIAGVYEECVSENGFELSDLSEFQVESVEEFVALTERYPLDDFDAAYMELRETLDFEGIMLRYAEEHGGAF